MLPFCSFLNYDILPKEIYKMLPLAFSNPLRNYKMLPFCKPLNNFKMLPLYNPLKNYKCFLFLWRIITCSSLASVWIIIKYSCFAGLEIRSSVFRANCLFLAKKMSEWAIRSKKRAIHSFAHFWWAKWAIRSFLVSEMSDLLTSLIFGEPNEQFTHIAHQKRGNERKWAIR